MHGKPFTWGGFNNLKDIASKKSHNLKVSDAAL